MEKIEKKIANNYGSFEVVFTHGQGATLTDVNGKTYIDFVAGIGVNSLGHNYAPLVEAVQKQAAREMHVSNYYFSDVGLEFAEKLLAATGFTGGAFINSGAEANEVAIKLARKYGHLHGGAGRRVIYTLKNSFHGRTLATLTATAQDVFHPEHFAPYVDCFKSIAANDWEAIKTAFDDTTAALFIECVQGEGGVNLIDAEWAKAAAAAARKAGAIVMADEVQTGMGRTGTLLASEQLGFEPDVVTLAKGIAGGVPMGACLFRNAADGVLVVGDHNSTFAGNPLASSAGLVVLKTLTAHGFLDSVKEKGERIRQTILGWNLPIVKEVRGRGLMLGTAIDASVKPGDIQKRCLEEGLCVCTAGKDVVRFLPPLNISDTEIEKGLAIFKKVLESAK